MQIVYEHKISVTCYADPPVHHHFHEINQEICVGQCEILRGKFSEMYKLYFLMLSNTVEKCGLNDIWEVNRVDESLYPSQGLGIYF